MKRHITAALAVLGLLLSLLPQPGAASALHERLLPPDGAPGSRERRYGVYVPEALPADGEAPLVMVLHGCRQDESNMIAETGFTALAEEHGFVVVFPFVTSWGRFDFRTENCWGFWQSGNRTEGSGEAGDLRRIIAAVEAEFGTDPTRRNVAGLSSGAAMAVAMAVAYSEDIAATGAVSGLPFGESSWAVSLACWLPPWPRSAGAAVAAMEAEQRSADERRLVPLMVIHSENDCRVRIVNARNLRDSWIAHHGASPAPVSVRDCAEDGIACSHVRFADAAGRVVVETVFYAGPGGDRSHFWPGDGTGDYADPAGPSASALLWAFFAAAGAQGK
jgi:poly(hydroxyalkanoate) depolymerase family esterase